MTTFEITIQRQLEADSWPIIVEQSEPGVFLPVHTTGQLNLNVENLASQSDFTSYGTHLGEALFQDNIRDAFTRARANSDDNLRLLLFIEAPNLKTLRWERLCAPIDGHWQLLALDQRVLYSIYLPSHTDRRFPPIGRRDLKALIIAANPTGLDGFGLDTFDDNRTAHSIKKALGNIPADILGGPNVAEASGPPTLDALCERITAEQYTLLHLVAHGRFMPRTGETILYLADKNNQVDPVPASRLLERLTNLRGNKGLPQFTFLSTCESANPSAEGALGGLGQRLVRELGMPAVIAMTDKVSIETAQTLAEKFYLRLREHGEIDRALVEGYVGIANRYDVTVPALYSRLGERPLFSDSLDRSLTTKEIEYGLNQLEDLLEIRAPTLLGQLHIQAKILRGTLQAEEANLSQAVRQERRNTLTDINTLSEEIVDLNFNALALGQQAPNYDSRCPFLGLYAFRAENTEFFFGREKLVEALRHKIADENFLAVLGPSGSGKSSVIFAGLIPSLQKENPALKMITFAPSTTPLENLKLCLGENGLNLETLTPQKNLILVVDQFEETFTLCPTEETRKTFLETVLNLTDYFKVVLTMRADFWGHCARYRRLKEMMQRYQELIGPMDAGELRRSMELQAGAVGLRFEANLSNQILDDVEGEPGAMPLLQHALLELWLRRHGRWLKTEEYEDLGGVQRAIAQTAEKIYKDLTSEQQSGVRNIFVRLTRLDDGDGGEESRDTRRRVNASELIPAGTNPATTTALVQQLATARLVVTSVNPVTEQEEVEVSHEALIRHWPRLQEWLDEDRVSLRLRERVRQAAQTWHENGRADDFIQHRGIQLEQAKALIHAPRFGLNVLEQEYIEACDALRVRQEEEKERRRQQELDQARRMAFYSISGLVIFAILGVVSLFLWRQAVAARNAADEARQEAELRSHLAQARQLAAHSLAVQGDNPPLSILLGVESLEATRAWSITVPEASEALFSALSNAGGLSLKGHTSEIYAIASTTDEKWLISGDENGTILLWDRQQALTQQSPQIITTSHGNIFDIAVDPDNNWFATAGLDGSASIWSLTDFSAPEKTFVGHASPILSLAISPQGDWMATGSGDKTIRLWDLRQLNNFTQTSQAIILSGFTDNVQAVAFSPNGKWLVGGGDDARLRMWDLTTIESGSTPTYSFDDRANIFALTFSPNGHWLISGGGTPPWISTNSVDANIYLRDMRRIADPAVQNEPLVLDRHSTYITDLAVSPDNRWLVSSSWDATAFLWSLENLDQPPKTLQGHEGIIRAINIDRQSEQIFTGSDDRTIRVWNLLDPHTAPTVLGQHQAGVTDVDLSHNNRWVMTTSEDGLVRLWLTSRLYERPIILSSEQGSLHTMALSPDSQWLATGGDSTNIDLWDLGNLRFNKPAFVLRGHTNSLRKLEISPNNQHLISNSFDGTVRVWDLERPAAQPIVLQDPEGGITALDLDITGRWLATGNERGIARLWDLQNLAAPVRVFSGHSDGIISLALSHSGRWLATGSEDQSVLLWDLDQPLAESKALELTGHSDGVLVVSLSNDEHWLASGGWDNNVLLWDLTAENIAQSRHIIRGHQSWINEIDFAPEWGWLISGSHDSTIRLWPLNQIDGNQAPITLHGHKGLITDMTLSHDGEQLISASSDHTARLWPLNPDTWRNLACATAGRNFTQAEIELYLSNISDSRSITSCQ